MKFDPYEKQKEEAGRFATFAWIGSSLFLFLTSNQISIFSWQAALFIFGGMFFAAIILGIFGYALQRLVAKVLTKTLGKSSIPISKQASIIKGIGWLLVALNLLIVYVVAKFVFGFIE